VFIVIAALQTLDRILKGEATRPAALRNGSIDLPVTGLAVVVTVLGAFYGGCMGAFALLARWGTDGRTDGYLQILASAAKVPMLFLLTLVVTFPSLYVFNALVGSRLAFAAVSQLMMAALAVIMAVLASFGTILLFFSLCSTSYPFIVLLNVAMFAVAGLLGVRFLLQTLRRLSAAAEWGPAATAAVPPVLVPTPDADGSAEPAAVDAGPPTLPPAFEPGALSPPPGQVVSPQVRAIFRVWVLVFGLVGAQMGWVLRPFIGSPTTPFTFFRERDGSFFEAVATQVERLVLGPKSGQWNDTKGGKYRQVTGRGGSGAGPATTTGSGAEGDRGTR
jgi:hypothetical protein